ncbi:MAG: 50S ribosomal protein L21 [Candidatus Ozemobacteraceae bacterium]
MYAIIELGGKQYSVEKGSKFRCEKLTQEANATFAVEKVLMVHDGQKVQIGRPYLNGVEVKVKVVGHGRAKKIIGLKYKHKINYRRHYGHRQAFTAIQIEEIKA